MSKPKTAKCELCSQAAEVGGNGTTHYYIGKEREQAILECADLCKAYSNQVGQLRGSLTAKGASVGALDCEEKIRALLNDKKETKE